MGLRSFTTTDVSEWELMAPELDGQNEHPWLRDPATGLAWLFKPVVRHGDRRQGEDWVEKVAAEIAHCLDVPAATVELATGTGG